MWPAQEHGQRLHYKALWSPFTWPHTHPSTALCYYIHTHTHRIHRHSCPFVSVLFLHGGVEKGCDPSHCRSLSRSSTSLHPLPVHLKLERGSALINTHWNPFTSYRLNIHTFQAYMEAYHYVLPLYLSVLNEFVFMASSQSHGFWTTSNTGMNIACNLKDICWFKRTTLSCPIYSASVLCVYMRQRRQTVWE